MKDETLRSSAATTRHCTNRNHPRNHQRPRLGLGNRPGDECVRSEVSQVVAAYDPTCVVDTFSKRAQGAGNGELFETAGAAGAADDGNRAALSRAPPTSDQAIVVDVSVAVACWPVVCAGGGAMSKVKGVPARP